MLKTPELAMSRSRKFTTIYNGRREVWKDYEQAKAYFLELMMTAEGEERDRAECVYIQLLHGLTSAVMRTSNKNRALPKIDNALILLVTNYLLMLPAI